MLTYIKSHVYFVELEVRDMEVLFLVSVGTAILWLAFGNKKDWSGM